MKELYLAVKTRLIEVVLELQGVDIWRDQTNNPQEDFPLFTPCVLLKIRLEYEKPKNKREPNGYSQSAKAIVQAHVIQQDIFSDDLVDSEGVTGFSICDKVYKALQGFSSDVFTPFNRVSFEQIDNERFYFEGVIVFECIYEDAGTPKKYEDIIKQNAVIAPAIDMP